MSATTNESDSQNRVLLQRVILPQESQQDSAMLYIDSGVAFGAQINTMTGGVKKSAGDSDTAVADTGASGSVDMHLEDVESRLSTRVRPGSRLSFGTYFNAFPASYWRRWTEIETISLRVRTVGAGSIIVYKSNARGSIQHEKSIRVSGTTTTEVDLSLKAFGDGGWYWFDVVTGAEPIVMEEASWWGYAQEKPRPKLTMEITTMDKVDYCMRNLSELGAHPEALDLIDELLIVDQGKKLLAEAEGFSEVAGRLGGKLRIIEQDNIGGSGGFTRGMYEAVHNGSDYVLLMDDDVELEPESIQRMLTFATYCKKPTIVGGHMFDLHARSVLHTFGETVNMWSIFPDQPLAEQYLGHDFARSNLRTTSWMHRRVDVDYNGWWMCMIPTKIIKEIGLSLPLFLKWDDSEYGLRAKAQGFPTVSFPGAAVWHISWANKDDGVGWQSYYHCRNRLITGLLHSPYRGGGNVVGLTGAIDFKHLISMQYYTSALRAMAQEDIFEGPEALFRLQAERLGEIRQLSAEFTDAQMKSEPDDFPEIKVSKPPKHGGKLTSPSYLFLLPNLLKTMVKQVLPVSQERQDHPQGQIPHIDNRWWRLSKFDSVLVSNAEGTAMSWYKRQPKVVREGLANVAKQNMQLRLKWNSLTKQYREALPRITSFDAWEKAFEKHTKNEFRP
ncbi:glycosyltransferase [Haematomicrobium sanguinis]|uniref:glycosyltransferase n=1 Tax=Haematomicrobium sanguinis TaxID=479106 RepID=UPI000479FF90|nr:glycosyltransferase [Haematomicrobium sanguinis]